MSRFATRRTGARQASAALRRYNTEAASVLAAASAERHEAHTAILAAQAALDAAAPRDLTLLAPGARIRTRHGWWTVIKVNAKTVQATGCFGRELVAIDRIIEVQPCGS